MTTTVVPTTSVRFGQVTFFISALVSRKKSRVVNHHSRGLATIALLLLSSIRFPDESPGDWQAKRGSNPQPAVLETAALPIELLACKCRKSEQMQRFATKFPASYLVSRCNVCF